MIWLLKSHPGIAEQHTGTQGVVLETSQHEGSPSKTILQVDINGGMGQEEGDHRYMVVGTGLVEWGAVTAGPVLPIDIQGVVLQEDSPRQLHGALGCCPIEYLHCRRKQRQQAGNSRQAAGGSRKQEAGGRKEEAGRRKEDVVHGVYILHLLIQVNSSNSSSFQFCTLQEPNVQLLHFRH